MAKGTIVAIGGQEDKSGAKAILRRVAAPGQRIEVIPTASRDPRPLGDLYLDLFRGLKADAGVLDIRDARDAGRAEAVERIAKADAVFLTGGDQMRLMEVLAGTPLLDALRKRHAAGATVAGTSAGAAVLGTTMIVGGDQATMRKGALRTTQGFGLLEPCIVDTHFLERARLQRLVEAVIATPEHVGVGLAEDTAFVVSDGHTLEVVGSGLMVVADGRKANSNAERSKAGDLLAAEGVALHAVAAGSTFDLRTGKVARR